MAVIVGIELTKKLPAKAVAGSAYRVEGTVKIFDAVGTPPFVYARVQRKDWLKPDALEETNYDRGWPVPISGKFSIDFKPEKEGEYKVTVVATPAPLSLPLVGVFPTLAESDVMTVSVGQRPPAAFRFSAVVIDGKSLQLKNHDADSKFLIQKKTSDTLEIKPSFEWVGPSKSCTISVTAGYKGFAGGYNPNTEEYTKNIELPESPDTPYIGTIEEPIKVPLIDAENVSDGAIEIVAKLPGASDYISQIWNVYRTKETEGAFRFTDMKIDGKIVNLADHNANSGLLLQKTTADYLDVIPGFDWKGPQKTATISIRAGYKDWLGGFSPKTGEYTRSVQLPASPSQVYSGELDSPIRIPLTDAGGLDDGAIEVVLKVSGMSDYISHIWDVYTTKGGGTPGGGDGIAFDLARPSASISQVSPGSTVAIQCPVISRSTKTQSVTVKVMIYEGSILPGRGALLDSKAVDVTIAPNETRNVSINHTAVVGTIDRRDVGVQVIMSGQVVEQEEWDDIFYVTQPSGPPGGGDTISFDLVRPSATPSQATPGSTVAIQCPVISLCDKSQSITARIMIYEGSIIYKHGTLLDTKTLTFTIAPGQTYNVNVAHSASAGTIDRRDVGIDIIINSQVVDSGEWDDIFYVTQTPAPPTTPPAADIRNIDMAVAGGTYNIGDRVSFTLTYEYKGKSQSGQMTLSIGTGVYPTFNVKQNYSPMPVGFDQAMDWTRVTVSGSFILTAVLERGQTYSIRTKLETLSDPTQETDTDWGVIQISQAAVGVSFQAAIWGIPPFGSYQYWSCSYWDPGIGDFIGDRQWYNSYNKISFNNVRPGGYLAVFLRRDSTVSSQFSSPVFEPADGGLYTYDVQTGRIY